MTPRLLAALLLVALLPAADTAAHVMTTAHGAAPCRTIDYSDPAQGELSFEDEFDGASVDTTKWNVRDGESLSFDSARILADNVAVHDGLLDITGRRQTVKGREWTTGYLDTIGKFSQEHGRWEMRAKVSTDGSRTRGVWPAFWLRSDVTKGEIDVMETYGAPATQAPDPSTSYEWTIWKDTTKATGRERFHGPAHPASHTPPIHEDFHTYAVNWSPVCVTFWFDDELVGTVDMDEAPWLATSLTGPFNIRLNQQIGSDYWGRPDPVHTKPEVHYLVDHVRVHAPAP